MLSQLFPHRSVIRDIAQLSLQIEARRNAGLPVDPSALRVQQAALAQFERLPPHEQYYANMTYQADRQAIASATNRAVTQARASEFQRQVDDTMRQLSPGLAGKPNGVPLALASALRNYSAVEVKSRKLPTGAEADARVRAATGMTQAEYAKKLDRALEVRDKAKNGDWQQWRDYVATHFPDQAFGDVNKLVRDWQLESVGLEMQRRAEASTPDTVTLRATPEDLRRLDIIEAISEVEGSNSESVFRKGHADRLAEIVSEGFDRAGNPREGEAGLRADIARAMLDHGGTFEVNTGGYGAGHEGDRATDEIVSVDDEE
jgi:hypothetical protein